MGFMFPIKQLKGLKFLQTEKTLCSLKGEGKAVNLKEGFFSPLPKRKKLYVLTQQRLRLYVPFPPPPQPLKYHMCMV